MRTQLNDTVLAHGSSSFALVGLVTVAGLGATLSVEATGAVSALPVFALFGIVAALTLSSAP